MPGRHEAPELKHRKGSLQARDRFPESLTNEGHECCQCRTGPVYGDWQSHPQSALSVDIHLRAQPQPKAARRSEICSYYLDTRRVGLVRQTSFHRSNLKLFSYDHNRLDSNPIAESVGD